MPFTIGGEWIPSEPSKETKEEKASHKKVAVRRVKRKKALLTVVYNLHPDKHPLKELASDIKKQLGVGGSIKDGNLEFQGDHVAEVVEILNARGIHAS